MRFVLGAQDWVLRPGEVASFGTTVPHWFGSTGDEPAEILSIFGRPGEQMTIRTHAFVGRAQGNVDGSRLVDHASLAIMLARMSALPVFDCGALFNALDAQRADRGLNWTLLADELWQQSSELNAQRTDHPLCGGAILRLPKRGAISCQHALFILRWIRRAPEDFLTGPVVDVDDVALPEAGTDSRLRWNLPQTHTALNEQRRERELTWAELAQEINCTPSRLTNLRTARFADMDLAMRITQWLGQPAAAFVHPAKW